MLQTNAAGIGQLLVPYPFPPSCSCGTSSTHFVGKYNVVAVFFFAYVVAVAHATFTVTAGPIAASPAGASASCAIVYASRIFASGGT
jgi:hypothetical protein